MKFRHATIARVLNAQATSAAHIRDCERCAHLYSIAYDEAAKGETTEPSYENSCAWFNRERVSGNR
jgi:hypothetical protein